MAPISQHTLSGRERVLCMCMCVCSMKRNMSEICRFVCSANTRLEERVNGYLIRSQLIDIVFWC